MRLKKLLIIIPFLGASLAGCIKEDRSDCDPEDNVELIFTYSTESTMPFTDFITSVDVLLFDEDSYYIRRERAELGNDPALFESMRVTLMPGKYYVVAWANVAGHSSFSELTPRVKLFSDCYLEITEDIADTGDPIYYAPNKKEAGSRSGAATRSEPAVYEVDVQWGKRTVKTLDFVRAHRTINVWIKGLLDQSGGQSLHPTVGVSDLWCRYDFYLTPQPTRRNYSQLSREEIVAGEAYSKATFYSALGDINGLTHIDISRTSDGTLFQTANLKQFLEDNNITDTDDIDILFVFTDMGVTITVPQWEEKPVQPGAN